MPSSTFLLRALLAAAMLCAAAMPRAADDVNDVERLRRAGDTASALQSADRHLAAQPADAGMRFLKGTLLAEAGRAGEAMAQWKSLTEDHPDLAEPYNNIAALHVQRGEYAEALAALQTALRNRPDYGTALENLGMVHLLLARQAYALALRATPDNDAVARQLAYLRDVPPSVDPAPRVRGKP
jgi:tetratricopeptide (TPR) repeat protein